MKYIKLTLFLLLFISTIVYSADEDKGKITLSTDIGRGEIHLKRKFSLNSEKDDPSMTVLGFSAGYQFDTNVILESNFSVAANDNLFSADDDYKLYELKAFLGYSFEVKHWFRFVPKIGVGRWELDTKEGKLHNDKRKFDEFTGSDFYYQLNLEFPMQDLLSINVSFMNNDYDFGRVSAVKAGVKFTF